MQVSRQYHFEFAHPVDKLWAVISDTPRWGEASGFPRYQANEELQPDGSVKVFGKVRLAGLNLAWEELPSNWIAERWFEQQRLFSSGPIALMTNSATLQDQGDSSLLQLGLSFETRNLIGKCLAKRMLAVYEPKVRALLSTAEQLIQAEKPQLFESAYSPSESARQRAAQLATKISESPYHHGLASRLVDYINGHQEVDLWAMRPIEIARHWGYKPRQLIELFLQSVRDGLLESRWDILCPRCRVSQSKVGNMGDLPDGVHCEACNIDFQSDFARNVELSFSPSPSVREVEFGFYCRSGPGVTPHIKGQWSLVPGSSRELELALAPGDYRVRTLEAGDEIELHWDSDRFPAIELHDRKIVIAGDSAAGLVSISNRSSLHRTVVVEEVNWLQDVLTAEQVTTMQAFRDLFSDQVLRPGDEVSIRNISFMFTDLVGSSALFIARGDAEAYHLVREHFAMLSDIVRDHDGSIVKTVGDGIHAAFLRPDDALGAALAMQQSMPDFNRRLDLQDIAIRIGLHTGSSIAVTLNERLDYYGEAVNLSSRLEGQGAAGDITMSKSFTEDPAIREILRDHALATDEVSVKGFSQPVPIARINPVVNHAA